MLHTFIEGRGNTKKAILDYCLSNFDSEKIWLVDSLQVFDPYYLSRIDIARARAMLRTVKISRPFTFYQLREKVFGFMKIPLDEKSTIIISSMDCFNSDGDTFEISILTKVLFRVLQRLQSLTGCKVIVCLQDKSMVPLAKEYGEVRSWEEQSYQLGTR